MDFVQLIPLQVVMPLMLLLLFSLVRSSRTSCILTIVVFGLCLSTAICILSAIVNKTEGLTYYMGGWEPPFGIELKVSFLTEVMVSLISFVGFVSSIYALYALPNEINEKKHYLINTATLLSYTGMVGMLITNDIFNVYVFLEISSLSAYTLISATGRKEGLVSSFEYLIIGTIGATFYLIGIGFLYSISGTLNMSDLAVKIPQLIDNKMFKIGVVFVMLGLILKSALFPFSSWMVNAYSSAPTFVSSFMSGTGTKVSIYLIMKYIYVIFGSKFILEEMFFQEFLTFLSLLAIAYGSYFALKQTSFRKLLAYSSIAQIGYAVFGFALNSKDGIIFGIMQIITHSITKVPLFIIAGLCYMVNKTDEIEKIASLNTKKIKWFYLILALSLLGLPMTAGFITKWYLLSATVLKTEFFLFQFSFVVISITSVFPLFYLQDIWKKMSSGSFCGPKLCGAKELGVPLYIIVLIFIIVLVNVAIGVYPQMLLKFIEQDVLVFFTDF